MLMAVYAESNHENAEDFFPGEGMEATLPKVEEGFCAFMDEFLADSRNACYAREELGTWVSALRPVRLPGFWWLEALETASSRDEPFADSPHVALDARALPRVLVDCPLCTLVDRAKEEPLRGGFHYFYR